MPITVFKPSLHGFHFNNQFSSEDILGELASIPSWLVPDTGWGLCGGMCFAALDRYFRNQRVPNETDPPPKGTGLFSELVNRQMDSVSSVGLSNILDYQERPDEGHWYSPKHSLGHLTQSVQWPDVRGKLDAGIPTTVCLIRAEPYDPRIGNNHQVVAYGYQIDGNKVRLNVYDPNKRDRDDVVVGFTIGKAHSDLDAYQEPGPDPRGFLRVPFDRQEVVIPIPPPGVVAVEEQLEWIWTAFS